MLSLRERIELLESDLKAVPMRISPYRDLPFAILRYDPEEEWKLRREAQLLATRMGEVGKHVHLISLAELLWQVIDETEGLDAVVRWEREQGFEAAQAKVNTYLSDDMWMPLTDVLAERFEALDPQRHIVFLIRAAAMAPAIYHMSALLDGMQGRIEVPTILFYPGSLEGTTGLRFMAQKQIEATGNYRVKIYG